MKQEIYPFPSTPGQPQGSPCTVHHWQLGDPKWLSQRRYPTECTSDGHVAFYTLLHLTTKTSTKHLTVKIDPSPQINMIPLRRYRETFPQKTTENGYPKPSSLNPTSHSWISHDGKPQPFPRPIHCRCQTCFPGQVIPNMLLCIWGHPKSTYSPVVCYIRMIRILQFNVPSLVVQVNIDAISLHTPGNFRKTMKMKNVVSFKDPLTKQIPQPHCSPYLSPCSSGKRKTVKTVTFKNPIKDCTPTLHNPTIQS